MVRTVECLSIFLFFTSLQVVKSSRFKIDILTLDRRIRQEVDDSRSLVVVKRAENACTDYAKVDDTQNLNYPSGFENLPKPWEVNPKTTVARSATVTTSIKTFFTLKVPGLGATTIEDVLNKLEQHGCLSFPYGGSVRDQFLNMTPNDLDMESNCNNETILRICKNAWGVKNCSGNKKNGIVHIGNMKTGGGDIEEVIDATVWNETFFGSGVALEYTTNSLAYFSSGLDIVIDLTGYGINDTCNKEIRIPVGGDMRYEWANYKNDTVKVYRYWKLRVKGYNPVDMNTKKFIVSDAMSRIMTNNITFKSFYCLTALGGKWKSKNNTCEIQKNCTDALKKKYIYDRKFEDDLGEFWRNTTKDVISKLGCGSCNTTKGEWMKLCSSSSPTQMHFFMLLPTLLAVVTQIKNY